MKKAKQAQDIERYKELALAAGAQRSTRMMDLGDSTTSVMLMTSCWGSLARNQRL